MGEIRGLRVLLSQLLLSVPKDSFITPEDGSEVPEYLMKSVSAILEGCSSKILSEDYNELLINERCQKVLNQYPSIDLDTVLRKYVLQVIENISAVTESESQSLLLVHLIAVALLQNFLQANFTGPSVSFSCEERLFPTIDKKLLTSDSIRLLSIDGQMAYDLVTDPLSLILSQLIFECLMGIDAECSLINKRKDVTLDEFVSHNTSRINELSGNPLMASIMWWRSRALQSQLSVLSEPPSILTALTSLLLSSRVLEALFIPDGYNDYNKHLSALINLELARGAIHGQSESQAIAHLERVKDITRFQFILSGAKAKRTKFQQFHTSSLIVLAKSSENSVFRTIKSQDKPESFDLNSDLLLERPQFESLDDLELTDDRNSKRIKFDSSGYEELNSERVLPIAPHSKDIPTELKALDPNDQPALTDIDNIQLMLRFNILKHTSPSNHTLVEEELLALVSRVLYTSSENVNWSIFSRALWERSLLETTKAKTIERGLLQMTSLVEEIGLKIKKKVIPLASDEEYSPASDRLRYIHQIPLMSQWQMDGKLAEKYMSIGVFRSAIEIYERLHLYCEAALCYAATDNEKEAERILLNRIKTNPEDSRAVSILGDLRQDPSLWEKAWEINRYSKAKASLSRYHFNPPPSSGVQRNLSVAIKHMNECLRVEPLNYENWFFYGCCGLEDSQFELASEAFTRCVYLDDNNSYAWSNLATSLLKLEKIRPAFNAMKNSLRCSGESKVSWKIYENYLNVALQLNEWNDVLIAVKGLIQIRGSSEGEAAIDIPAVEKLVDILVSTEFPKDEGERLTHYQRSTIDLVCNIIPKIITSSARCWRIVSKVELWRRQPWYALDALEKAYRALANASDLETDEKSWNEAVEACCDLAAAYESLGELPGKHNAGDTVCQDWKYKARTSIRSLMSKGKAMWEDSEGWEKLVELRAEFTS